MKKILLITALLISLTSCAATPRISPKKRGIDPEFKPYIQEYKFIIGKGYESKFKKLSMNFANLSPGVLGTCYWLLNGEYEIEINKNWWYNEYTNFIDKKFVSYHELEHCIKHRLHSDRKKKVEDIVDFWEEILYQVGIISKPGYLEDGCPASIMHSVIFSFSCQIKHYDYYIDEIRNTK